MFPYRSWRVCPSPTTEDIQDELLAAVLRTHGDCIRDYEQHDTLFDECVDEKLSDKVGWVL
jgi:hypothetical protein